MAVKIVLLIVFFAVMIGVGLYCRKSAAGVQGFVLGGRNVGSWLTAFAFGGYLRGLCRPVRLEVRHVGHVDRTG